MTYWTSLLAFLSLTAICSAKDFEPFAGPQPVAVMLQENPWASVMGAETPRIAIYENGEVIYTRSGPDLKSDTYFYAELGFTALGEVMDHLKPVTEVQGLKPMYSLDDDTNQGAVLFYLRVGGKEVVTSVYGLHPEDDREGFRVRTIGKIPDQLRELFHYLLTVEFTETRPWHPAYMEAMFWPFDDATDGVLGWPKSWPDLNSDRAVKRQNGYSIFLDGTMRNPLQDFLAGEKEKGAVELDGRKWTVASRPVFPSEPVWRKAFSKIDGE